VLDWFPNRAFVTNWSIKLDRGNNIAEIIYICIQKVLHAGSDTNVSIFAGSRNFLVLNLVYIAAEFNCIHTWIHFIFEPSVPLATSPLAQNWKLSLHRTLFNRTEQKTSFSLLPCCHMPSDRLRWVFLKVLL